MKLIIDENISRNIHDLLTSNGFDVISIDKISKGAKDGEVLKIVKDRQRIFITRDKKFAQSFAKIEHDGVIWLDTPLKYHIEVFTKAIHKFKNIAFNNTVMKLNKDNYTIMTKRKWYVPYKEKICKY